MTTQKEARQQGPGNQGIALGKQNHSTTLQTYSNDIKRLHIEAQQHAANAVQRAVEAGQLLNESKPQVGHGGWLKFVESTGMGIRTAQNYMKLARNADELKSADLAHLGVEKALKYLAAPKAEEPEPEETDDPGQQQYEDYKPVLDIGEYAYHRFSDVCQIWVWPDGYGDHIFLWVYGNGDGTVDVVTLKSKESGTYKMEIRPDDMTLDDALIYRSEMFAQKPELGPCLSPEVAFGRMSYRDRRYWPAWRLVGQAINEGLKLHVPSRDVKKAVHSKKLKEWLDDRGVGDMDADAIGSSIFAIEKWDWICKIRDKAIEEKEASHD